MAASFKGPAIVGSFGKRFANQIWAGKSRDPASLPSFPASASRKVAQYSLYSSSYDKNVDDQVRPTVVPDYVIDSKSDKYWSPHPKTGVFGPDDPNAAVGGGDNTGLRTPPAAGNGSSVLDQTTWFRSLEDVDKPPVA